MSVDGTQEPDPPPTFTDPLTGPVPDDWRDSPTRRSRGDSPHIEIAKPVEPDPDLVRNMVDAAFGRDDDSSGGSTGSEAEGAAQAGAENSASDRATEESSGHEVEPGRPNMLPLMLGLRPRSGQVVEKAQTQSQFRKPSSGTAGVLVALALLVLFIILAIQLVASLFNSISGVFS